MKIRLSPRQKAGLAVALAVLLWIPTGISQDQQTVVTGHSTFYNGDTFDRCLASVAGILRSRVMWFNDMVLAERYSGKGTFIYITEHGAQDPTQMSKLYTEGTVYDFIDPNGAHWHVDEVFWWKNLTYTETRSGTGNPIDDPSNYEPSSYARADTFANRTYAWIVELSERPIHDQFAGADPHDLYNFLDLVDVCKFHKNNATAFHTEQHDGTCGCLDIDHGHPGGTGAHNHTAALADIWIGGQPVIVPVGVGGADDDAQWTSDWARDPSAPQDAQRAPGAAMNQTGVP